MAEKTTDIIFQGEEEFQKKEVRMQRVFMGAVVIFVISVVHFRMTISGPGYVVSFFQGVALWAVVVMVYAFHNVFKLSRQAMEQLRRRSFVDGVSGVFNYRYLDIRLAEEQERTRRYGGFTAVLYIDLDKFKQVNDRFGHLTGNLVLEQLALLMVRKVRSCDVLGRIGGDEFLAVLPETDRRQGAILADRLRQAIEAYRLDLGKGQVVDFVRASIGVAAFPVNGDTMEDVIAAADQAVYEAKKRGGNTVCIASDFVSGEKETESLLRDFRHRK